MLTVQLGKKKIKMASAWDELSRGQVLGLLKAIVKSASRKQAQILALRILLKVRWSHFFRISSESIARQLPLTHWVFNQNTLTRQLLPVLKVPLGKAWPVRKLSLLRYYGPGDNFRTLCVWEYIFCERYFLSYHQNKDSSDLDRLMAVLYRAKVSPYAPQSPGFLGDTREQFNENTVLLRLASIEKVDPWLKQLVLTWYTGCRYRLTKTYPFVFEEPVKGKRASANPWLDMLGQLPAEKFGTINQVRQENLHTVLYFINNLIKDSKKQ